MFPFIRILRPALETKPIELTSLEATNQFLSVHTSPLVTLIARLGLVCMYVHVRAYITNSCFPYSVQLCTCCTPFKTVSLHHLLLISRGISGWFELSCVEYVQMWLTGFCRIPSACDCTSYMQEKNWREKITQWKWK